MTANGEVLSRDIYSVTRLNREVRAVLEGSFPAIWIQGEISNLARPASGHMYFSLKDRSSQVRCAMFKNQNRLLNIAPENGMEILARAAISLYEGRGEFQLIIEYMEPAGAGALQKAYEELKQKLHQEGLFDEQYKQPLPGFPKTIGLITSPTGAAIRDILNILGRRYPLADVVLYPVQVQGEGSAEMIVQAITTADQRRDTDVLIITRGGGSLEDLWSFNDERVARAIHTCTLPVITGIGHEIDFTIADFVADMRAPTPSAAAELAVPDRTELLHRLGLKRGKLLAFIRHQLEASSKHLLQLEKRLPDPVRQLQFIGQRLDDIVSHLQQVIRLIFSEHHKLLLQTSARLGQQNPLHKIRISVEKCHHLEEQLRHCMSSVLREKKAILEQQGRALHTVSPLATLERGYAIVMHNDTIVRNATDVKTGELIKSRLAKGNIYSKVTTIEKE